MLLFMLDLLHTHLLGGRGIDITYSLNSFIEKQVLREKEFLPGWSVVLIPDDRKTKSVPRIVPFHHSLSTGAACAELELGKEELIGTMEQVHRPL